MKYNIGRNKEKIKFFCWHNGKEEVETSSRGWGVIFSVSQLKLIRYKLERKGISLRFFFKYVDTIDGLVC